MEYEQCLEYMHNHCKTGISGGLVRTKEMLALLGNPQEQLKVIHVGGTNGKGSTCAILECILRTAGHQVGLFTSPHLTSYTERIQINRTWITQEVFAELLTMLICDIVPQLLTKGFAHPGEFELFTVAAFVYFKDKTDFVILEVGLGGKMDPTNLVSYPLLTVLTSISLDHCEILGDTLTAIAIEKAGIIKRRVPVISAPQALEVKTVLQRNAVQKEAPLYFTDMFVQPYYPVALQGSYQQENCHLAVQAALLLEKKGALRLLEDVWQRALPFVHWPGRMEYFALTDAKGVLFDGAHNLDGIRVLVENLQKSYGNRQLVLLMGILDDKAQFQMLQEIVPLAEGVVVTKPASSRAKHWQQMVHDIEMLHPASSVLACENYQQAMDLAVSKLKTGGLLCVTGSLYLVGSCRQYFLEVLN